MLRGLLASSSLAAVALLAAGGCAHPSPKRAPSSPEVGGPIFAFHVDLWPNLGEVLFHDVLLGRPHFHGNKSLAGVTLAPSTGLTVDEAVAWKKALGYEARFDSASGFDDDLERARRFLVASGSAEPLASGGIPEEWRAVLEPAAAVYRRHFWASDETADRAFIGRVEPLVRTYGAAMVSRLTAVYQTPLPPTPIVVEVTPAVPAFGAATLGEPPFAPPHAPLIIVSSRDPGYSDCALEMLFHETSHLLVDRVQGMLEASAKKQGRELPPQLWHDLLFYTAGHVAKELLGPSYVPYAERREQWLFVGTEAGPPTLAVLVHAWQPYLDGRVTLEAAVDACVAEIGKAAT